MEFSNTDILNKFQTYPNNIRKNLEYIRSIIFEVAGENKINIDETLKWGEISYVSRNGSTIRIDWKEKFPKRYSIFFNCKSRLVETFKEIYPNKFNFVGNRELYFEKDDTIPLLELKHCIFLSLNYHKLKHLPLLGA